MSLTAVDGSLTGAAIAQRGKPGTAKLGPCISSLFWAFNASASACVRAVATISQTPLANREDRDIDSGYCILPLTLSDSRLHRSVASPTTSKLDHTPAQHIHHGRRIFTAEAQQQRQAGPAGRGGSWKGIASFPLQGPASSSPPLQSSLVMRFVNNDFQENKEPTIGGMSLLPLPSQCRS
jgi:hypothetical protein